MMGGVEDIEDPFAQGAWDDQAVVIEEEAVSFKHPVAYLPVRSAAGRVVARAASQRRYN